MLKVNESYLLDVFISTDDAYIRSKDESTKAGIATSKQSLICAIYLKKGYFNYIFL